MHMLKLLGVVVLLATSVAQADLTWRAVWEWSLPKNTEADLIRLVASAQSLGFNVLLMSPPSGREQFLAAECHRRGMLLYTSMVFTGGHPAWQQVMTPLQEAGVGAPLGEEDQHGGEPVHPGEFMATPMPCWNRPEVHVFFANKVRQMAQGPTDGLAFDFIGYRNYERCHCAQCAASLAAYRREHPGTTAVQWAEQVLVDFNNEMAKVARATRSNIRLTTHVYPVFRPHPCYGYRLNLEEVGETVSWFFRPHWPMCKVEAYVRQVVQQQGAVWPNQQAAPFIGFDASKLRDYRSARRIKAEIDLIQKSGVKALQFAELGYLLDKPPVAEAVAQALGGHYQARRH